jgi:quinohemoprotein ethanol dehydrogenase
MRARTRAAGILFAALTLSAIGCQQELPARSAAAPESSPPVPHAPAVSFAVDTVRVANADEREIDNWLVHGRTFSEQRYSPLKNINTANVGDLGLAWQLDLEADRGLEATPIAVDGVLFTTGSWSRVYALDARTGRLKWSYDPHVAGSVARDSCCDVVSRGLAVWEGHVLVATFDGRLIALDAASGQVQWQVDTIVDHRMPYTITGAPRIVKGRVIIGNGGNEFGVRGYFSAYDSATGKLAWRFFTVPASAHGPFERPELEKAARTWDPDGKVWPGKGGGAAWDSMAYDPELDLLYVGTGNGGPWPQSVRSPAGGDNLYTSSILAVSAETGRLVWYYQPTPGDQWDFDATQHLILAQLQWQGRSRKILMQASKNGFFYVLDRQTGELLSAEKFAYTTWATRVDPNTGRPVLSEHAAYGKDGKESFVYPWVAGAHNWQPMSFSPRTGLVYIPAQQAWWIHSAQRVTHFDEQVDDLDRLRGNQELRRTQGALLAWDPVRHKAAWEVTYPTLSSGGTLVTGGDVVFQGTTDGNFSAYDARNGHLLKRTFTGTAIIAPPMTYRVDGVQYIAVLAGFGGATSFMMDAQNPARRYLNTGRILAFKLGGGPVPLPPLKPAPVQAERKFELEASVPTIERGTQLYRANCGRCHGMLTSKPLLPDLRELSYEKHQIFEVIVLGGALQPLGMGSFADVLSKEDVHAIHAAIVYLRDHPYPEPPTVGPPSNIRPGR